MLNPSEARRCERVLVTDRDYDTRLALQDHLCEAGFQVSLAGDHAELCLKLLTWRPDVVLAHAGFRPRDTRALARLIRSSARRPVPAVLICDETPQLEMGAKVVLRSLLFADVVTALRSALVGADEAQQPLRGLVRALDARGGQTRTC